MRIAYTIVLCFFTIAISAQSSIVWEPAISVATSNYGNAHPRISVNGSGEPVIVWGNYDEASCIFVRRNGNSFSTPITLNDTAISIFATSWAGPNLAAKGDTIYVVMKQLPEEQTPILITSSFDGGLTFNQPVPVDLIAPDFSRFPVATIDDAGHPIVGFMKFGPLLRDGLWTVTRSNDHGQTFTPDVFAGNWSGGVACDCCPAALVSEGNTVAVMYRDNLNNIRDTWAGISYDNGQTFSAGTNIDQNNWMQMLCPSMGPDGIILNDTLYAVFASGALGPMKSFLSKTSLSNVQCSGSNELVSGGNQTYPRIAHSGNAAAVVFKQSVNGSGQAVVCFYSDITTGNPLFRDTIATAAVINADIALSNGKIYVVWEDGASGTVKFKSGDYSQSVSINEPANKRSFICYPNPSDGNTLFLSLDGSNEEVLVDITDVTGKLIRNEIVKFSSGQAKLSTALSSGSYLVTIRNKNMSLHQRLVVN